MEAESGKTAKLLNNILGFVGLVGEVCASIVKQPGKYVILISLVSALFIFVWGLIARKDQSHSIKKALAWSGIVVGVLTIFFFSVVGFILISVSDSPPSSSGRMLSEEVKEFQLNSNQRTDQLSGQYTLKFSQEANLIEVGLVPTPQDSDAVKEFYVTTKGLPEYTNAMSLWTNKTTDIETYYKVLNPPTGFNVILNSTVQLKQSRLSPSLTVHVYYKYFKHNLLWRLQKWAYSNYSG